MDDRKTSVGQSIKGSQESQARSKTTLFVVITVLLLLVLSLIAIIFARLEVFSASPHIAFALFLGVIATIAVGVGLMALVFHSSRSGHDRGE